MKIGALDIETIPSQEIPEDAIPKFDPDDVKLGNTKDPEKVAAKIEGARDSSKTILNIENGRNA